MRRRGHGAINGTLVVPLSLYRERERERERERKRDRQTDRQTDRERQQADRHVNQNVIPHQRAEPQKEILASKKPRSFKTELDDFDKCVVRRTVIEMYGRKNIRQFMHSAVYNLRSRHPNRPKTEHVPATEVLGIGFENSKRKC